GVHDLPGRLDAHLAQLGEGGLEAVLGRLPHGLVVDHQALLGLVLRAHDDHAQLLALAARLVGMADDRVDQRPAPDRLVGDHEDPVRSGAHSVVPACTVAAAVGTGSFSLNTPCTAPGTPYS